MDGLWPTCLAPRTTGTIHSGSVAWVLSSIKMDRNCILASLGSPAPTQVQQMTSAFWGRECARHQGTCTANVPRSPKQAGRDTDTIPVHALLNNYGNKWPLPDNICPGCNDPNFRDPKWLGFTPKKELGALRQPLRGSAKPRTPCSG